MHGEPFARVADPVHKVRVVGRIEEGRRPAVAAIHDLIAESAHRCPRCSWHDPYPVPPKNRLQAEKPECPLALAKAPLRGWGKREKGSCPEKLDQIPLLAP